jgi:hypothetical protein
MPDEDDNYDVQGLAPSTKTAPLTEREILDCLKMNLRLGAENADKLSRGERGPVYQEFRENLRLVDGCCRQMSGWREDTRWSPFGVKIRELQQRVGRWLVEKEPGWKFKSAGEILRFAFAQALDLETKKTGKVGAILPKLPTPETRTQGRPSSMSGLILPPGFKTPKESVN